MSGTRLLRYDLYRVSDRTLMAWEILPENHSLRWQPPIDWPDWPGDYEWRVGDWSLTSPVAEADELDLAWLSHFPDDGVER